jgi:tRNA-splicing endonuclease subunit Sen2
MTGGRQLSLEEITALKRKERAEFKEERLKKERLERERQLYVEGKLVRTEDVTEVMEIDEAEKPKRKRQRMTMPVDKLNLPVYTEEYLDKEVLQLAPEEALFLMHLNLLHVRLEASETNLTLSQFLHLVTTTSRSDDPFLVRYIVYYHFRRQQIIVKPGLKFGVDYLLYNRPIPFTHAGFCVNVLGSYHLWPEAGERLFRERVTWQEINLWQRLMGNVRKKLRIMWVEIPPVMDGDWRDVSDRKEWEALLANYKVREVCNSRMVIARERDVKPEK